MYAVRSTNKRLLITAQIDMSGGSRLLAVKPPLNHAGNATTAILRTSWRSFRVALSLIQRTVNASYGPNIRIGVFCSIGQVASMHEDEATRSLLRASEKNALTRCHGCSNKLNYRTFAFYLAVNFRTHMISVYLANARITRIKIKMESSFTQRVVATLVCPKTATIPEQL